MRALARKSPQVTRSSSVLPPSLPPTHPPPCMQTFRTSAVEGQSVPVAAAGHEHDASIAAAAGRGSMGWGFKGMYVYTYVCECVCVCACVCGCLCVCTMSFQNEKDITFLQLGDEKQCPLVEDEDVEDAFNHPAVKYNCNYNKNILDVRKRCDEQLYYTLKNVDDIEIGFVKEPSTQRSICFLNRTRIIINKYWNDKLKKKGDLFISESDNDEQKQDICIHEGMPVIA
jgi:hypothetical protein